MEEKMKSGANISIFYFEDWKMSSIEHKNAILLMIKESLKQKGALHSYPFALGGATNLKK